MEELALDRRMKDGYVCVSGGQLRELLSGGLFFLQEVICYMIEERLMVGEGVL